MNLVLHENPGVRRLAGAWLILALTALALSTCFAVLLVLARIPLSGGLAAPLLFRSALVLHVSLAVVVWFLAGAAGIWTILGGRAGFHRWFAWGFACAGTLAMSSAIFLGSAAPVLANYMPVLDSPVFLGGLASFLGGVALCGIFSIHEAWQFKVSKQPETWRIGVIFSIGVAGIALGALLVSLILMGSVDIAGRFENIAWGPGHLLQFVYVLLMMMGWMMLGETIFATVMSRGWMIALIILAAVPALVSPAIYWIFPSDSQEYRQAFTTLMTWGAWPAASLLAGRILFLFAKSSRAIWTKIEAAPLLLSVSLFLLGCIFGASIRSESTMIPAHYHGTVGAVTLAYMMLGYRLLPAFGICLRAERLTRWQPVIYGIGLLILASSLAWSGWLGVPRKTLHIDVIAQYPAYFAAMSLAGIGGLMAIIGAALFVFNVGYSIWKCKEGKEKTSRRDVRLRALGLAVGLILFIGLPITYWPRELTSVPPVKSVVDMHSAEVDSRFSQGVVMLHAKQFDNAAIAFEHVLKLAPKMPEAYVNLGFAMIGLERYEEARTFFESAIELRAMQANAYYGLAIALDGAGDVPSALGAMRTYVHLAKGQENYVRKARSAIWEWEEELKQAGLKGKISNK